MLKLTYLPCGHEERVLKKDPRHATTVERVAKFGLSGSTIHSSRCPQCAEYDRQAVAHQDAEDAQNATLATSVAC